MTDKRDQVNWNDQAAIWSRVPSAKTAITQACSAIDKLVEHKFVFDTPAACTDARKHLTDAYDFCVELHNRWSDLGTEAGNESAKEDAELSLKPYEEKQDKALTKLNEYIAKYSSTASESTRAATNPQSPANPPKVSTCKLLFPTHHTTNEIQHPGRVEAMAGSFQKVLRCQQPTPTASGHTTRLPPSGIGPIVTGDIGTATVPRNICIRARWLHRYAGGRI